MVLMIKKKASVTSLHDVICHLAICGDSVGAHMRSRRVQHDAADRGRVVLVHRVGHLPGPLAGGHVEATTCN